MCGRILTTWGFGPNGIDFMKFNDIDIVKHLSYIRYKWYVEVCTPAVKQWKGTC